MEVKHRFLHEEAQLFRQIYVNNSVLQETYVKAQQLLDAKEYKGALLGSDPAGNAGEFAKPAHLFAGDISCVVVIVRRWRCRLL